MIIYRTYFKLEAPVNDLDEARDYLTSDDMTPYLKERHECADFRNEIISIEWVLRDEDSGYIELHTAREFTDAELQTVSEWVSGQNSDGLGEGFEQQDFACYKDESYDYDDDEDGYFEEDYIMASFDWKTNEYRFEKA